jgi:hypothetical protein
LAPNASHETRSEKHIDVYQSFFLYGRQRVGAIHGETDDKDNHDGAWNPEKGLARAFQAFVPFDHPARVL